MVLPNEVSTTSAPCSWARRATWKAMEESMSTPVTSSFLPSSNMWVTFRWGSGRCLAAEWVADPVGEGQCPMPRPPSTGMTAPVTYAASGPARKRTTPATSSGVANRPAGMAAW